ncbi:family 20 glycosylhydrolase [Flavihumibacter sp. CACIAM 22H1]|uniref:glycoside hydrolase family 20 protein n=1 Tax=Flavihumibacter sp. CACIAM 22H1 TaxID=1812911 RepID=UPI0007A8FC90|nr:family 20 glycosylhydrolase [Flavihumibacter sp. CACIAM 22H1]KYP13329.1 MAG: beta-N-acetylhexosaminidase [Flavihumibacter sp. CACIAM 22H1]
MKRCYWLVSIFFVLAGKLLIAQNPVGNKQVSIIPAPMETKLGTGIFQILPSTIIQLNGKEAELAAAATFFNSQLKRIAGYSLSTGTAGTNFIEFSLKELPALNKEGYQLSVQPNRISITATTKAGLLYGMQSVFQCLPAIRTNAPLQVPVLEITDQPRFGYRGIMIDVSRHFFAPEAMKDIIDLLASYKMNVFHWHLTDDPGWRIQIDKYPALTDMAAWRVDRSGIPWNERKAAQPGEKASYGGYYTKDQVREIVAYAAERNITVIPEIEMPGHSVAAVSAYPQLSCTGQEQALITGGQYPSGIQTNYCPGNDSVYIFLQDVLDEVIALFPSPLIHIGGDEVDKTAWKACAKCQARMKKEGLKDEHELQSYFIKRMERYLNSKGRQIIGWDEILEGGLAPGATVMSWRGEAGGIEAAKMKHPVIMTPGSPLYFDHYQAGPAGEPIAFGGFNPLKKVYAYDPVPVELKGTEFAQYVLGAQANLWTESIETREHLEYMLLPRMLALAEVVWSQTDKRNWTDFRQRLETHFTGLAQKGLRFSEGNFTVGIKPVISNGQLKVALDTEAPDATIHYTLDGSYPTTASPVYTTPVAITGNATLKAITVKNGKPKGNEPAVQHFVKHRATGMNVQYKFPNSNSYMADGPNALTDGIRGTEQVGKYWHGFSGTDMIATIDLQKAQTVKQVVLGCMQHYKDWIFFPSSVQVELSLDGKQFRKVGTYSNKTSPENTVSMQEDFSIAFAPTQTRYIRVTAKVLPACPKGHPGEGKPAWLFVDELLVK